MAKTKRGTKAAAPKKAAADKWRLSEILYAFTGLLSTRKAPLIFSGCHECSAPAEYLGEFIKVNGLQPPRSNYPKVKVPEGMDFLSNIPDKVVSVDEKALTVGEAAEVITRTLFNLPTPYQNEVIALVLQAMERRRVEVRDKRAEDLKQVEKAYFESNEHLEALRRIREGGLERLNFKTSGL